MKKLIILCVALALCLPAVVFAEPPETWNVPPGLTESTGPHLVFDSSMAGKTGEKGYWLTGLYGSWIQVYPVYQVYIVFTSGLTVTVTDDNGMITSLVMAALTNTRPVSLWIEGGYVTQAIIQ